VLLPELGGEVLPEGEGSAGEELLPVELAVVVQVVAVVGGLCPLELRQAAAVAQRHQHRRHLLELPQLQQTRKLLVDPLHILPVDRHRRLRIS
jgi:hypothetical protein